MVTITAVQLENLLKHDTNALAQIKDLQNTGLAETYGVAREDILLLIPRVEKENINEKITSSSGSVVNMRIAAASALATK